MAQEVIVEAEALVWVRLSRIQTSGSIPHGKNPIFLGHSVTNELGLALAPKHAFTLFT